MRKNSRHKPNKKKLSEYNKEGPQEQLKDRISKPRIHSMEPLREELEDLIFMMKMIRH
jgi:hypothetical protein